MCWYCGSPVKEEEPIGRSMICSSCGKDLRVCKNCRFYLPGASNDCRENSEPVKDRERANFCDWFSLNPALRSAQNAQENKNARAAFDDLFK